MQVSESMLGEQHLCGCGLRRDDPKEERGPDEDAPVETAEADSRGSVAADITETKEEQEGAPDA